MAEEIALLKDIKRTLKKILDVLLNASVDEHDQRKVVRE